MTVVQFILSRNGLDQSDDRPLYAYGVTDAERAELRTRPKSWRLGVDTTTRNDHTGQSGTRCGSR